jgi:PEP-CTERM motif
MHQNIAKRSLSLAPLVLAAMLSMGGISAQAATSTEAKLSELLHNNATLVFGDKVFSDFVFSAEKIFNPATNIELTEAEAAAMIDVKAGLIGQNIGLDFMTPFHAHGGELSGLHIDFTVTITDPTLYFSDVHVDGSPSVTGTGQATGVTTVNDLAHTLVAMQPPGLLKIYDYGVAGPNPPVLNTASDLLKPYHHKALMTESDLQFSANVGSNAEFAHYQVSFSQAVPEPSTYALALVGLVGVGLTSLRRRHQG